jgi:MSHA biogenesis protein MshP
MTYFPSTAGARQHGFALVVAIFIVVVLAMLGVMMVTIGGMQRATVSAAAQGTRAYYAARSGVEWGIYQAVVGSSCVATSPLGPPTTPTFALSVSGLNGFNVWVNCTSTQHRERSNTYNVYVITATATSGAFGDADYVSRTLQTTVTDALPP